MFVATLNRLSENKAENLLERIWFPVLDKDGKTDHGKDCIVIPE